MWAGAAGLGLVAASVPLAAQPVALPPPSVAVAPAGPDAAAVPAVPAGTIVRIRIQQDLSSRTAKRGDVFPILLAEDIVHEGRTVVPAGATGRGEVVHAAGKGFGGRAGELLLAARWLEHDGRRIPLRALRLGLTGEDQATQAMVATMVFAPVGLFVTGTSVQVMAGQLAEAKLSQPLPLAAAPGPAAASAPPPASQP